MSKRSEWTWKTGDPAANAQLHLKYEPGNWGDVLKGAWLLPVLRVLAEKTGRRPVRVLDPFAGAPEYPLLPASSERLTQLPAGEHAELLKGFAARGVWPSCATLAAAALQAYRVTPRLLVYDFHAPARERWAQVSGVQVLALQSGDDALSKPQRTKLAPDLVLYDSYDFFDRWGKVLDSLASCARTAPVLVYLLNTSPRGPGHTDQYARLVKKLGALAVELGPVLRARLPYDRIEPREHHEVLLLAPRAVSAGLEAELRACAEGLARVHADAGAFERIG